MVAMVVLVLVIQVVAALHSAAFRLLVGWGVDGMEAVLLVVLVLVPLLVPLVLVLAAFPVVHPLVRCACCLLSARLLMPHHSTSAMAVQVMVREMTRVVMVMLMLPDKASTSRHQQHTTKVLVPP